MTGVERYSPADRPLDAPLHIRYTEVSGSFAYPVGPIAVAVRNVTAPSESEAKAKCTRLPYFKTSV